MLSIIMYINLFKIIDEYKSVDNVQNYLADDSNTTDDRKLLKEALNEWAKIYNISFKDYEINEKWLIVIFLLYYYPEEMNLSVDTPLYNKIGSVIKHIKNYKNGIDVLPEDFGKMLVTLKLLYNDWKKNDWNINIKLVINLYLQYDHILSSNIDIEDDLKNMWTIYKDELYNMVKLMSPGRYSYHIDRYKSMNMGGSNKELEKIIKKNIYNEYWLNLKKIYTEGDELLMKKIISDYNELRKKMIHLLDVNVDEIVLNEYNENHLLWILIKDITKFDSPYMDKLYDNIYLKWINKEGNVGLIDIIRLIFDRLEIIISLLNKEDE